MEKSYRKRLLWCTLVSNREDLRDAIQMQHYIYPQAKTKTVELEKRLEDLNRAIRDIEQQL